MLPGAIWAIWGLEGHPGRDRGSWAATAPWRGFWWHPEHVGDHFEGYLAVRGWPGRALYIG